MQLNYSILIGIDHLPTLCILEEYPELLIDDVSKHIQQDDMKNIFQKNDFIGLNHYQHI